MLKFSFLPIATSLAIAFTCGLNTVANAADADKAAKAPAPEEKKDSGKTAKKEHKHAKKSAEKAKESTEGSTESK